MSKKRYNNASQYFRDWTTAKLKQEAKGYHSSIYEVECYGVRDMIALDGILEELAKRGITPREELMF